MPKPLLVIVALAAAWYAYSQYAGNGLPVAGGGGAVHAPKVGGSTPVGVVNGGMKKAAGGISP